MMEAVLLLATIARRFRLEIEPGQTLELLPSITLRPRYPIHVRLRANDHEAERSPDTSRVPVEPVTDDLISSVDAVVDAFRRVAPSLDLIEAEAHRTC